MRILYAYTTAKKIIKKIGFNSHLISFIIGNSVNFHNSNDKSLLNKLYFLDSKKQIIDTMLVFIALER